MNEVHEIVQRALHTIDSPSLCFWNVLLEKLGHSEVEGPEACRTAVQGENKHEQMSENPCGILALALTRIVALGKCKLSAAQFLHL